MPLKTDIQKLAIDGIVEMFELDLTIYGGIVMRFYAGVNYVGTPLLWQGNYYNPIPVEAKGFAWENGRPTRPTLTVANTDGVISALCYQYKDFARAKLTRRKTLTKYLDAANFIGGVNPDADPLQEFPSQIYYIKRKSREIPGVAVEFELGTALDLEGIKLPRRLVLPTLCGFRYRIYSGGAFVYTHATCPFAGASYFDESGIATIAANDKCSHRLDTGCGPRYGAAPKPFGGFPGVGRVRSV